MKTKKFFAALLILSLAITVVACAGKVKVSNKAQEAICTVLAKKYNEKKSDVEFSCYGKFGKTYVIMYQRVDIAMPTDLTVDDVTFKFASPQQFDVYREGKLYTLKDAFDKGWLTHKNLLTVRRNHEAANKKLYE